MEWKRIARGEPVVEGVHRDFAGLLQVEIPLDQEPPGDWVACFLNPPGIPVSFSMHAPEVHGNTVTVTPPDAELEKYLQNVDDRIAAANRSYEADHLPRVRAGQARLDREEQKEADRLAEARETAKRFKEGK